MNKSLVLKDYYIFILLTICSVSLLIVRAVYVQNFLFYFFIWNLFLCWIPYLLSLCLLRLSKWKMRKPGKGLVLVGVGFVWLLFFPNAPYIITDFIHLDGFSFFRLVNHQYILNKSLLLWFDLIVYIFFITTGFLLGLRSLGIIHQLINHKYHSIIGLLFVLAVLVLSSFAIYLGRYIRVNSWDFFTQPISLLNLMLKNIQQDTISFVILFTGFLSVFYFVFYFFQQPIYQRNSYPLG
ncbi:MAG: DUF1361 domain-containing protein [Spirochaetes bacterium]|nr:DUF1361 domain-containing protein [Spirochaetota bacterium]